MGKKTSPERELAVIEAYQSKMKWKFIQEKYGISYKTIIGILHRHNIPPNRHFRNFMICRVCKINIPQNEYVVKHGNICRKCRLSMERQRQQKINARKRHWKYLLNYNYGISMDKFYELWKKQNRGKCAICGKQLKIMMRKADKTNSACVDHSHRDGKIRGLLCGYCNGNLLTYELHPKETIAYFNIYGF